MQITLDDVVAVVGDYRCKKHDEYIFQCPYCAQMGGDSHGDNLKYNVRKGVVTCFANYEHSREICRQIAKNKHNSFDNYSWQQNLTDTLIELTEQEKQDLTDCAICWNEQLLNSSHLLNLLYKKRGIAKETVEQVFLGFDIDDNCWTIPTFEYNVSAGQDNYVIGFEFRPIDFSKSGISRTIGTPKTLAMINEYTQDRECLAIVEGYFDGYALFQYLSEINQINGYHIITCSNGVQSLVKQIDLIDFTKYKKTYLFIDNDDVSQPVATKICEKYSFIEKIILDCGCKDFNEHYLKCIKKIN